VASLDLQRERCRDSNKVAGANVNAAYDDLLGRKATGESVDVAKVTDDFNKRELSSIPKLT